MCKSHGMWVGSGSLMFRLENGPFLETWRCSDLLAAQGDSFNEMTGQIFGRKERSPEVSCFLQCDVLESLRDVLLKSCF